MSEWQKMPEHLFPISERLFAVLVARTSGPQEAAMVLSHMYMSLWSYGKAEDGDLDEMLEGFCQLVRVNVAMAQAKEQGLQ